MAEQLKVLEKKIGNALIEHASLKFETYLIPLALNGIGGALAFGAVMASTKALCGGIWVGGNIELTNSTISFRPNAINRAVHKADYRLEIPLRDITDEKNEFGFVTGIICLQTESGAIKIRVYGAQDFAKRIRIQMTASSIALI